MLEAINWIVGKSDKNGSGKWLPLWMHAKDTAGVMEWLWNRWLPGAVRNQICDGMGSEEAAGKFCRFLGLIHDLGKMTPGFQSKILAEHPELQDQLDRRGLSLPIHCKEVPHARAGEVILLSLGCPKELAAVVGAHHGKPQTSAVGDAEPGRIIRGKYREQYMVDFNGNCEAYFENDRREDIWNALWQAWVQAALEMCGYAELQELPKLTVRQQVLLSGLLITADWIASNSYYFPLIDTDTAGTESAYPARIQTGMKKLDLPGPWEAQTYEMDAEDFRERFGFVPNSVQQLVLDCVRDAQASGEPGLWILEAQMGVGKTEAALAAAELLGTTTQSGGIFFGLPTQATANSMFSRVLDWAERQSENLRTSIKLAHGNADLNADYLALFQGQAQVDTEEGEGLTVHSWFEGRKVALLSDFVVGTVDQVLMAALIQKHVMLRHLGLAGKVVIIDEVHAYDAYMSRYLSTALTWLGAYRVPVILLSATLPASRRTELVQAYLGKRNMKPEPWMTSRQYPLLTWTVGKSVCQKTVQTEDVPRQVRIRCITDEERITVLDEALAEDGCACVVANTVRRAQELFTQVREQIPDANVLLLHASLLLPDRMKVEEEIVRWMGKNSTAAQRNKLIVIGTQVLEQSLDLDADFMLTDLCPMDLLLQRIGRLHRHKSHDPMRPQRLRQAVCCVVSPADGTLEQGAEAIYGPWLLNRTAELLPAEITLPGDIPNLVQNTYDDGAELTEELQAEREAYTRQEGTAQTKAGTYCMKKPVNFRDTIHGWLDKVDAGIGDAKAQAAVRDGDPSVDVLVLMEQDGEIHFLPWQESGARVSADCIPSQEERQEILQQRLRLPSLFGKTWMLDRAIDELEKLKLVHFAEWQNDPTFKEELVLLLDDTLSATLCGYKLKYDKNVGLYYEKMEIGA